MGARASFMSPFPPFTPRPSLPPPPSFAGVDEAAAIAVLILREDSSDLMALGGECV